MKLKNIFVQLYFQGKTTMLLVVFLTFPSTISAIFIVRKNEDNNPDQPLKSLLDPWNYALKRAERMCSSVDHFTPCACIPTLTTAHLHTDQGSTVSVEFPEFKCDEAVNKQREERGWVSQVIIDLFIYLFYFYFVSLRGGVRESR